MAGGRQVFVMLETEWVQGSSQTQDRSAHGGFRASLSPNPLLLQTRLSMCMLLAL